MKSFNGAGTPLGLRQVSCWRSGPTFFQFSGLCFCDGNLTPSGGPKWRNITASSSSGAAAYLKRTEATVLEGAPGSLEVFANRELPGWPGEQIM